MTLTYPTQYRYKTYIFASVSVNTTEKWRVALAVTMTSLTLRHYLTKLSMSASHASVHMASIGHTWAIVSDQSRWSDTVMIDCVVNSFWLTAFVFDLTLFLSFWLTAFMTDGVVKSFWVWLRFARIITIYHMLKNNSYFRWRKSSSHRHFKWSGRPPLAEHTNQRKHAAHWVPHCFWLSLRRTFSYLRRWSSGRVVGISPKAMQ